MPRKRIKSKKKKIDIDYTRLTDNLYDSICHSASMEEHLGNYKHLGYCGYIDGKYDYYFIFDKNDPKICRKIWNLHKKAIMERWEAEGKAGSRPFLWWICERPEDIKIIRYEKWTGLNDEPEPVELPDGSIEYEYPIYEDQAAYLKRLNLLEAWEIKALEGKNLYLEEGTEDLPYTY